MTDRKEEAIQGILAAASTAEVVELFDFITNIGQIDKEKADRYVRDMLAANASVIDPDLSDEQTIELLASTIQTVVGPVRFGANQHTKADIRGRLEFTGWIRPTLENPLLVLKEKSGGPDDERNFSYLFVNAVSKPNGRVTGFVSVSVQKVGDEVVITSHHKRPPQIEKKIRESEVIHRRPGAMGAFLESVRAGGADRIRPLFLRTDRPAIGTTDASIAPGDSSVPPTEQETNYLDGADLSVFQVVDVQFEPLVDDEFDHGRVSYVATVKGANVRTAFKLVEAKALITSNGLDGRVNGAYPAELQPRDRTRVASVMQIQKLSRELQPARLADSGLSSHGAPIIGIDRVVESGNGRSMAIIKAYAEGNAGEYRQYLEDNAELYGFTTGQVQSFAAPVLVRVRLDEVDRVAFAKDSNVSDMQAMSPTEQARIDAEAMDDGVMSLFSPDAAGNVLAASNQPFVSAFLAKLTGEQAAGLLTADGRPTRQVIERIRAAVFAKAYQHDDLLRLAVEEPDPEIRNVLTALTNAAPRFATMRTLSGEAHKQAVDTLAGGVSLAKTLDEEALAALVDATTIVREAKESGQSVDEYLKQGDMFGDRDPQAEALARFIAGNNRSVKRMAEAFTAMADEICQVLEHKGAAAADMFGEPPVDLVTVLARVNDHMAELYGADSGIQVSMFDDAASRKPKFKKAVLDAIYLTDKAHSVTQLVELFDYVQIPGGPDKFDALVAMMGRTVRAFKAAKDEPAMDRAVTEYATLISSIAAPIIVQSKLTERGVLWADNPINAWFDGKVGHYSWLNALVTAGQMVALAMRADTIREKGGPDMERALSIALDVFDSAYREAKFKPTDELLSWVYGKPVTREALRIEIAPEKAARFERYTADFEAQIRQLSLSVTTLTQEAAFAAVVDQHMSKQQVLDELAPHEHLTPDQRDELATLISSAAKEGIAARGSMGYARLYDAVVAFSRLQIGKDNFAAANGTAVDLYQHYVKLVKERVNSPVVEGAAPLRAMLDDLIADAMPEDEAAAIGAKVKIRISEASLADGYSLPALKADMNRFYQMVAGQMETPDIVRKKKRAHADRENNCINSGEALSKVTLWHEMGHFVEFKHPELLAAAKKLLSSRMAAVPDEVGKIAYLKHMTGTSAYKNEKAVNDGFFHPYVGKIYGNIGIDGASCTEVLSMGFQSLATDEGMATLAQKDPEHLALVLAAVKMLGNKYKEAK